MKSFITYINIYVFITLISTIYQIDYADQDLFDSDCEQSKWNPTNVTWFLNNSSQIRSTAPYSYQPENGFKQLEEKQYYTRWQELTLLIICTLMIVQQILMKSTQIKIMDLDFKDFNGDKQQLAQQIIQSSAIVLIIYSGLTLVSEVLSVYHTYMFDRSYRCLQKKVINNMRELMMINDYNELQNNMREKQDLQPLSNVEKMDMSQILMASDLWHLPLGSIRSIISGNKDTNFEIDWKYKQQLTFTFEFIKNQNLKKMLNQSVKEMNLIDTRMCNYLLKNRFMRNIKQISISLDTKIPLHIKEYLKYSDVDMDLKYAIDQLSDDMFIKTSIVEEYLNIENDGHSAGKIMKLLDEDVKMHDDKNEYFVNNDCQFRFLIEFMRELYLYSLFINIKDLENVFGEENPHMVKLLFNFTNGIVNKFINNSSKDPTFNHVLSTRKYIVLLLNLGVIIMLGLTQYQFSKKSISGMSNLRKVTIFLILFSGILLICNSVAVNVNQDICLDFYQIDSEQAWLPNNKGIGNWFKTIQIKNVTQNKNQDSAIYNIMQSLTTNNTYLMEQYHQTATLLLNGAFVWKPSMDQIHLIQEVAQKKFTRYLDEQSSDNLILWNKMLFIYEGLNFYHTMLERYNALIQSEHMRDMVHAGQHHICGHLLGQMTWSTWLQFLLLTSGSIALWIGQTQAVGQIEWLKGQTIPHCRTKQNDGASKTNIDNKKEAKPNTIRMLNDQQNINMNNTN